MNYTHLSIEERCCIRKYYNDGLSMREISRLIERSASTVMRELKRNRTYELDRYFYYPHTAEKKYRLRRRYCHRGMYTDDEIVGYVSARLKETWSPEQIACTPCGLKVPTARTIYRWLYDGYVAGGNLKVLRRKGRSRGEGDQGQVHCGEINQEEAQGHLFPQGGRALGAGYGGRRTRQVEGLLRHVRGAQDPVLHGGEDARQDCEEDGGHDSKDAFGIPAGDEEDHHLRQGQRVRQLEKHRGASGLPDVLRGPVLRMAEGDEREQQRASAGVLSKRKRPERSFGKDIEKEPSAFKRQA